MPTIRPARPPGLIPATFDESGEAEAAAAALVAPPGPTVMVGVTVMVTWEEVDEEEASEEPETEEVKAPELVDAEPEWEPDANEEPLSDIVEVELATEPP